MDFKIVSSQELEFDEEVSLNTYTDTVTVQVKVNSEQNEGTSKFTSMLENTLSRLAVLDGSETGERKPKRPALVLVGDSDVEEDPSHEERDWKILNVVFGKAPSPNDNEATFSFGTAQKSANAFFPLLARACGGYDQFSADLELEIGFEDAMVTTQAKDLMIQETAGQVNFVHTFPLSGSFQQSYQSWVDAYMPIPFPGKVTVVLKISADALDRLQVDNVEDPSSICRTMLSAAENDCNAVIIAANGARIKCHRGFLSAHSSVFKAMFESRMTEGITSTVEITDMSETSIRALLAYLYCWELKKAITCPSTAVDLLLAADKYDIPRLKDSVWDLLLVKDFSWWTVSSALRLLQFARYSAGDDTDDKFKMMEQRGRQVLKSKSPLELQECPEFQEIFNNPKTGIEFATYLVRS